MLLLLTPPTCIKKYISRGRKRMQTTFWAHSRAFYCLDNYTLKKIKLPIVLMCSRSVLTCSGFFISLRSLEICQSYHYENHQWTSAFHIFTFAFLIWPPLKNFQSSSLSIWDFWSNLSGIMWVQLKKKNSTIQSG